MRGQSRSQLTERGKEQLVKGNSLHRVDCRDSRVQGKQPVQQCEPLVLQRRHDEAVRHEPDQALEIERRRLQPVRVHVVVIRPGDLPVQLLDLHAEEVVFRRVVRVSPVAQFSLPLPCANGGKGLGNRVCDSTKDLTRSQSTADAALRTKDTRTALIIIVVSTGRLP